MVFNIDVIDKMTSSGLLRGRGIKGVDLNPVNLKGGIIALPCLPPLALVVVEAVDRVRVLVVPGLAANAIWEVGVGATNGQVEDEVELAIERSRVVLVDPRVVESLRESSTLVEALLGEVDLEHLVCRVIKVSVKLLIIPVETISVELCTEGFIVLVLKMSHLIAILIPAGTPVKSGTEPVVTLTSVAWSIPARLHDINFTRCGPRSIFVSFGKHPNGRPEPVTLRELSIDLNTAVLGRERVY